jgi:hypothetical protein
MKSTVTSNQVNIQLITSIWNGLNMGIITTRVLHKNQDDLKQIGYNSHWSMPSKFIGQKHKKTQAP